MFKKRLVSGLAAIILLMSTLSGCSNNSTNNTPETTQSPATTAAPETTEAPTEESTSEPEETVDAKITVDGNKFMVGENEIWINGANTPWIAWNDFGGNINGVSWDKEFEKLHENGINATRVWITCNGDVGIDIDENGYVTGATEMHWKSLDLLFALAKKHHVYIMATLISFDHFKETNNNYERWRAMMNDNDAIDSYINNYVIPFCERYKDNDYLWSIDLCNEPDWIAENRECGKLSWDLLGSYFARAAAAIHENSDVLVTIGFGMIKYNSDKHSGNYGSDEFLQSCYDNKNAYLDFNSTHYYEWQATWYSNPFDNSPAEFGLDDSKPSLLGEMPAVAMLGDVQGSEKRSLTECYEACYEKGWNGIMPWTSNGVDDCGDMDDIAPASAAILEKIENLIFPLGDREID